MTKKSSLTGALSHLDNRHSEQPSKPESEKKPKKFTVPPSREGKAVVAFFVEPEAQIQLGHMAVDGRTSIQAMMREALNDYFEKRGKARIA